ncbi:hypothetical protein LJC17_01040 [Acholeplasma sp. OttesenSCG-928-E16]|nr:hypothetical protein [Acholeplasma sp. OttesenSCG-928-E16]
MKKILIAVSFLVLMVLGACSFSLTPEINKAIKELEVPASVDANFTLPVLIDEVDIEYQVSSSAIKLGEIKNGSQSFLVTRQDADVTVSIKAVFSYEETGKTKTYKVSVLKKEAGGNIGEDSFTLTENLYYDNSIYYSYRYAVDGNNSDIYYAEDLVNYDFIGHERGGSYYYYDDYLELQETNEEYGFYKFANGIINSFSDDSAINIINNLYTNNDSANYDISLKVDFKDYYEATGTFKNVTAFNYYSLLLSKINSNLDLQEIFDALKAAETTSSTYNDLLEVLFTYMPRGLFVAFNQAISYEVADLFYYLIPTGDVLSLIDSSMTGYILEDIIMLYGDDLTHDAYGEALFAKFEGVLKSTNILDYLEMTETEYLEGYDMSGMATKYEISLKVSLKDGRLDKVLIEEDYKYTTAGQEYFANGTSKLVFIISAYGNTELTDLGVSQYDSYAKVKETLDTLIPDSLINEITLPNDFDPYVVTYSSTNANLVIVDLVDGTKITPIQGAMDITATLTVSVDLNGVKENYTFQITIPGAGSLLDAAESELNGILNITSLRDSFALPTTLQNGSVTLDYLSLNEESLKVETISGDLYLVAYPSDNLVSVNLKVTLTDTDANETKVITFTITIPKKLSDLGYTPNPNHSSAELYQETNMKLDDFVGLPTNSTTNSTATISQNLLVIPVEFTDYKFETNYDTTIKQGFFGTESQTGWESVKTYYEKSSYGNIIFNGHVTTKFQINQTSVSYNKTHGQDMPQVIIKAALDYFKNSLDLTQFDKNNDEVIDGIYLIYSAPYDGENYWAWQHMYYENDTWNGVYAGYYVWASYDFFNDPILEYQREANNVYVDINAQTLIHETGHMFGLMDYYDSGDSLSGGLGGYDMMDGNAGDHNSFSKLMMGWYVPQIITESTTVTIRPFVEVGEALLIPAGTWNNNYYSEYLMVEFYKPTSINKIFADGEYQFGQIGVKIFHVDAEYYGDTKSDGYWYFHTYDNQDTSHKLIKYIEGDGGNSIETSGWAEDSDLFVLNSTLKNYSWYKSYNGSKIAPFTITITAISNTSATIEILFN